ncbi:hypothetical protein ROHU_018025 [Labeo rohita]|uniref:Uncharacterized protein n=1 Tax=Labeo rohita TaxID=84645 RepID=A0A498NCY8_LABRO|nr:hypothetical protein ROHU_010990 [Labeo rohita]RXN30132.1 hypothetical protein ROHU_018025 [Labeo rohita]
MKTCLAYSSMTSWAECEAEPRLFVSQRSVDPIDPWLVPVVGPDAVYQPRAFRSPRPRRRGVNLRDLRSLRRVPRSVINACGPARASQSSDMRAEIKDKPTTRSQ